MTNYNTAIGEGAVLMLSKGERVALALQITGDDGLPVDLTGALLKFTAKRSLDDTDDRALIAKDSDADEGLGGIEITDAEAGRAVIQFEPENTDTLKSGRYYFDVKYISGDSSVVTYPIRLGLLQIDEVVTRA